ncbi:MAG: Patatin [Firmicutes bacterium]|nr:Patatin [Bacillota bacterium]
MGEMIVRVGRWPISDGRKVGVALSGGGLRGLAHIGVLKVLQENHVSIDMISGTSAGAIIAAMYASGYDPEEMQAIAETVNLGALIDLKLSAGDLFKHGAKWFLKGNLRIWSTLPSGIIKGDKIEKYFEGLWQRYTMRDTRIPLAITSVDINSGDTVFFTTPLAAKRGILNARYNHNALLSDAVRASISIPGIFFPKKFRGMTLVDGAVKNNLPTDILRYMGADIVIAVDLGYDGQPNEDIKTVGEILMQCIDIMGREVTLLKGEQYANVIIRPITGDIAFKDNRQVVLCIGRGQEAAWGKMKQIKAIVSC